MRTTPIVCHLRQGPIVRFCDIRVRNWDISRNLVKCPERDPQCPKSALARSDRVRQIRLSPQCHPYRMRLEVDGCLCVPWLSPFYRSRL